MRVKTKIQLYGEDYNEALNYLRYITKEMEIVKYGEVEPNWYEASIIVSKEDYETLVGYRDIEFKDSKVFKPNSKQLQTMR